MPDFQVFLADFQEFPADFQVFLADFQVWHFWTHHCVYLKTPESQTKPSITNSWHNCEEFFFSKIKNCGVQNTSSRKYGALQAKLKVNRVVMTNCQTVVILLSHYSVRTIFHSLFVQILWLTQTDRLTRVQQLKLLQRETAATELCCGSEWHPAHNTVMYGT